MIVRPRPTFLQLFFVMRGSVVPRILPQILGFALYSGSSLSSRASSISISASSASRLSGWWA
ncbi:bestrophin family ion channel [Mesorhizobium sp. B2-4-17]|uniref:bestrophin family ion channel n=1 Tax=Mesorhizobium sp. B2-4-17 TaxID=2589932 RepID=UPI001FEDC9F0|nr:bestrophin family ion channel [Mesorhizobium sp. B2-4-17]